MNQFCSSERGFLIRYSRKCIKEQGTAWMKSLSLREMEQLDLIWHSLPDAWLRGF